MGNAQVTTQNLEVVSTDTERSLVLVKGAVPGSKGGYVRIADAVKKPLPEGTPYPCAIKGQEPPSPAEASAEDAGEEEVAGEKAVEETPAEDPAADAKAEEAPEEAPEEAAPAEDGGKPEEGKDQGEKE